PRVGDLGETPLRRHGMLAAQNDHGATAPQLAVELLFPVAACRYAVLRIEIEEDGPMLPRFQASPQALGGRLVLAAMGDEDRTHGTSAAMCCSALQRLPR